MSLVHSHFESAFPFTVFIVVSTFLVVLVLVYPWDIRDAFEIGNIVITRFPTSSLKMPSNSAKIRVM
jgi:hypothetical protein